MFADVDAVAAATCRLRLSVARQQTRPTTNPAKPNHFRGRQQILRDLARDDAERIDDRQHDNRRDGQPNRVLLPLGPQPHGVVGKRVRHDRDVAADHGRELRPGEQEAAPRPERPVEIFVVAAVARIGRRQLGIANGPAPGEHAAHEPQRQRRPRARRRSSKHHGRRAKNRRADDDPDDDAHRVPQAEPRGDEVAGIRADFRHAI